MKDKIKSQLFDLDVQIETAIQNHADLMAMLCDKQCILNMALLAPDEINSVNELNPIE